ncbi:pheromone receptor [Colletotrichum orchidophilum]|uniref:Pheromone receptor n=1 Tax=Colletotrichum orchidophilum TaxID=1209926 RepID=A0A1G4AYL7_9PEZI|nr:pheromone receptor [Colletotrichum orchidophilum]OHE94237.1 pheromone receptor [Colletotrichum orchidophilum]
MAEFNPFDQIFVLKTSLDTAEDTDLALSPMIIDALYKQDIATCANYSSQIGASFMLLLIIIAMTPSVRLIKASLWVHITALVVNTVRMTLMVVFFTTPNWTNFYTRFTSNYSRVTAADSHLSIATEAISLTLHTLVQVSLGMQAWALVKLLPRRWKWRFTGISCFVSASAIGLRLGLSIIKTDAILILSPARPIWVAKGSGVVGAISIAYYCALFNIRLLIHLVKNRGILPSRQRLNAMEVLIITNGILMIIPVIFAALNWGPWSSLELSSLTYTSVVVFLPLGTLIASRASASTSRGEPQPTCCTVHPAAPLKAAPTIEMPSNVYGSVQGAVTSYIASSRSRQRGQTDAIDLIDVELQQIDGNDLEKGFIRVDREVEFYEERI